MLYLFVICVLAAFFNLLCVSQGKGKEPEEAKPIVPPPLTGPTEFTKASMDVLKGFESTWLDRDESANFAQRHDEDLAREVIRPDVSEEIRKQVDLMLEDQLANFKKQLAAGGKAKKGKKGLFCCCCWFCGVLACGVRKHFACALCRQERQEGKERRQKSEAAARREGMRWDGCRPHAVRADRKQDREQCAA